MAPTEDLETFLRRMDPEDLIAMLLELAQTHEAVHARLSRLQLADQPDKLAAGFKKALSDWQRSTEYHDYREADDFSHMLRGWLDQVARELLPKSPTAALSLFEAFIESDATWFEQTDSDGEIGSVMATACDYWLTTATRIKGPPIDWPERLLVLYEFDAYGGRVGLLQNADRLLDKRSLHELVTRLETRLTQALAAPQSDGRLSHRVSHFSGALTLLSKALHDPDIEMHATLLHSPDPNARR